MARPPLIYSVLKPVVGVALRWYYQQITTTGLERVPADGPIFLAVNHPNAMIDALTVGWAVPRRVHFTAKATLFTNPVAAALLRHIGVIPLKRAADEAKRGEGAIDPSRNAASFDAVADALEKHAAVVIFPEGKSHDDPRMAPLRTGLARMAMHAADRGVRGIRIIPVGLLFERKEAPRSRILLQVGEPLDVDALREAQLSVTTFTELVTARLEAVTLNFDSAEDAERLHVVGHTLAPLLEPARNLSDGSTPLGVVLAVIRRLDRGLTRVRALGDDTLLARATAFETRVRAFRARLDALQIDVHDVAIDPGTGAGTWFVVREALLAAMLVPVGLWGRVTHWFPIQLARLLALRNVRARDEPAMNTLVFGVVFVLATYAVETAIVDWFFGGWWALAFFLTLVPSASSDLRYGDRTRRARQRASAFRQFRANATLQRELLSEADGIRADAAALERALNER